MVTQVTNRSQQHSIFKTFHIPASSTHSVSLSLSPPPSLSPPMEHVNITPNLKEQSHQSKPKKSRTIISRFLGFFGFSRKPRSFPEKKPNKIDILPERKKLKRQRSWFPWSWFCIKSPGTKTVPLDSTVPDSKRTSNASKSKRQKPLTNHGTPRQTPARVSSDRAPKERPEQVCEKH